MAEAKQAKDCVTAELLPQTRHDTCVKQSSLNCTCHGHLQLRPFKLAPSVQNHGIRCPKCWHQVSKTLARGVQNFGTRCPKSWHQASKILAPFVKNAPIVWVAQLTFCCYHCLSAAAMPIHPRGRGLRRLRRRRRGHYRTLSVELLRTVYDRLIDDPEVTNKTLCDNYQLKARTAARLRAEFQEASSFDAFHQKGSTGAYASHM